MVAVISFCQSALEVVLARALVVNLRHRNTVHSHVELTVAVPAFSDAHVGLSR
ncbi:hypothetical protein MSS4_03427 [Mycobacterium marinum]|nr:hypothetical protein MSS4_03427 [Mycobacterium marinum]